MKTFNFKRSIVKIETESGVHEIRFPTMAEATEFDKNLLKEDVDHEKYIADYFKKLGLDKKVYHELEYWQVKQLLGYFRDPLEKEPKALK